MAAPARWDDAQLEARLFQRVGDVVGVPRPRPDMAWVHQELKRPGVTLQRLHLEYLEHHPADGYRFSQFCRHYHDWARTLAPPMRQVHRAGEKAFVDFSGQRPAIIDRTTGELVRVELFVGVLGASSYVDAEACPAQDLPAWITAHVRMVEFFGGAPALFVPDNLKSGITQPCRYEPVINRTYLEFAEHYGAAVVPARAGHPRDKAVVEASVLVAQRWILAVLRHRQFFTLAELNAAIWDLRPGLNARRMRRLGVSRRTLFEQLDRPLLRPLPTTRYEVAAGRLGGDDGASHGRAGHGHPRHQAASRARLPRLPRAHAPGQDPRRRPPGSGRRPRPLARRRQLPHRAEHPGQRARPGPARGRPRALAGAPDPSQHPRQCLLHPRGAAMLAHATIDTLSALRLPALAEAFQRQLGAPEFADLSFEDRVGLLVDAEWTHREQRKLQRRLRQANLRRQAVLEDIDWQSPRRGLDKALVQSLATCAWIAQHRNLLLIGPTGIGKSWLGEAFAERACRAGYAAYCVRASRLFHELHVARGDGSYLRILARLAKTDLLVIDDWGLAALTGPERYDLLEVLEDRAERASTLITSQVPVKAWHELIAEPTIADSICDRLVHTAYVIELQGPSLRETRAKGQPASRDGGAATLPAESAATPSGPRKRP